MQVGDLLCLWAGAGSNRRPSTFQARGRVFAGVRGGPAEREQRRQQGVAKGANAHELLPELLPGRLRCGAAARVGDIGSVVPRGAAGRRGPGGRERPFSCGIEKHGRSCSGSPGSRTAHDRVAAPPRAGDEEAFRDATPASPRPKGRPNGPGRGWSRSRVSCPPRVVRVGVRTDRACVKAPLRAVPARARVPA